MHRSELANDDVDRQSGGGLAACKTKAGKFGGSCTRWLFTDVSGCKVRGGRK